MSTILSIAVLCACLALATAYGGTGASNWNTYPVLPEPRPLPPPRPMPMPMPIVHQIYPVIPLIPKPRPLPIVQPAIFQHFGYHNGPSNAAFGRSQGWGFPLETPKMVPLTGFGAGIGGGFRSGLMFDPYCDLDSLSSGMPFHYTGFNDFHHIAADPLVNTDQLFDADPRFNTGFRRDEFASSKFQSQFPVEQSQFPVGQSRFPVGQSQFPVGQSQFPVGQSPFPVDPQQTLKNDLVLKNKLN